MFNGKNIIRLFAFLDAFLFFRFGPQIIYPGFSNFDIWWIILIDFLRIITLFSFIFTAYGLFCYKKWAYILSYVQLPFRFLFLFLTFGFLTEFKGLNLNMNYNYIFILCYILEIMRVFVTYRIHKNI